MTEYLDLIREGTGGNRCDVTPVFADAAAFTELLDDLVALVGALEFDLVAGIDALGFILGGAFAARTGKGFVAVRKGGKLPAPADRITFVDYTGDSKQLEVRADSDWPGRRILLVDEWIETGAQVRAALHLLRAKGATVVAVATVHCDENELTRALAGDVAILALRRGR